VRIPGFTAQASLGEAAPFRGAAVFNDLGGNVIPALYVCEEWKYMCIVPPGGGHCYWGWVCLEWKTLPV